MAKILFIQQEAAEKFGVMSLSAVLKKAGHQTRMFIQLLEKEPILDFVRRWQPDMVAFSVTTVERDWTLDLATKIKKEFSVYSVFGGAEPTHNPEIIKHQAVDFICRGEGERGLVMLLNRLEKGKSLVGIKNFWFKEKDKIVRNELDRLIVDLDRLPPPDRKLYYHYLLLKNMATKKFLGSRGCPYNCSYCSNHAYRRLFRGKGQFVRFRSPELIIEEIKQVKKKYGLKTVYFADETFTLNHDWLLKLLKLYRQKIKMPFSCMARANELNQKVVEALKASGCYYISFGLESGSQVIRNQVLQRRMSNENLLKAAKLLKKYQIPFLTHSMFVLPGESLEDAFKTVTMNIKMKTDSVWDTVFQPFEYTSIYEYCLRKKLIRKDQEVDSTHGSSVIKNPDKKQIENLRKLDWLTVKLPWMLPLTKKLVHLPSNVFFDLILKVSEVYSFKRRYHLSPWEMIRLAWGTGDKLG